MRNILIFGQSMNKSTLTFLTIFSFFFFRAAKLFFNSYIEQNSRFLVNNINDLSSIFTILLEIQVKFVTLTDTIKFLLYLMVVNRMFYALLAFWYNINTKFCSLHRLDDMSKTPYEKGRPTEVELLILLLMMHCHNVALLSCPICGQPYA